MSGYLILYLFLFLLFFFGFFNFNDKINLSLLMLISIAVSVFCGLRKDSFDYEQYYSFFELITNEWAYSANGIEYFLGYFEPGFVFFIYFLGGLSIEPKYFFLLISIVSVFPVAFVYRKTFKNMELECILLFFSMSYYSLYFTQIRQGLALVFAFLFLYFFSRGKNKVAFFSLVVGVIFHSSIIAFFPLLFLSKIRFSIFTSFCVVMLSFFFNYYDIFYEYLLSIIGYIFPFLESKLNLYFYSYRDNASVSFLNGSSLVSIILILLLPLFKNKINSNPESKIDIGLIYWGICLGLFYYSCFPSAGEVGGRLYRNMVVFYPYAISMLLQLMPIGLYRKALTLILSAGFVFVYAHYNKPLIIYEVMRL